MLSSSFEEIGTLNWYLGICVLISWITVFLCLFQGVKSSGKVNFYHSSRKDDRLGSLRHRNCSRHYSFCSLRPSFYYGRIACCHFTFPETRLVYFKGFQGEFCQFEVVKHS